MKKCLICHREFEPKSNRSKWCEKCAKEVRRQAQKLIMQKKRHKPKEAPKPTFKPKDSTFIKAQVHKPIEEKSQDWLSEIADINKGKTDSKPSKAENLECRSIQYKLSNYEPLTMSEKAHVSNCNSCSRFYAKYGYTSIKGIKSFWESETGEKETDKDLQDKLKEDFPDYT